VTDAERDQLAATLGRSILEALEPVVARLVEERLGVHRSLFTWKELEERGYPVAVWRWRWKTHRVELERAGAAVPGRPLMIDPRRFEQVLRGELTP
jgi:hypothetical protein